MLFISRVKFPGQTYFLRSHFFYFLLFSLVCLVIVNVLSILTLFDLLQLLKELLIARSEIILSVTLTFQCILVLICCGNLLVNFYPPNAWSKTQYWLCTHFTKYFFHLMNCEFWLQNFELSCNHSLLFYYLLTKMISNFSTSRQYASKCLVLCESLTNQLLMMP